MPLTLRPIPPDSFPLVIEVAKAVCAEQIRMNAEEKGTAVPSATERALLVDELWAGSDAEDEDNRNRYLNGAWAAIQVMTRGSQVISSAADPTPPLPERTTPIPVSTGVPNIQRAPVETLTPEARRERAEARGAAIVSGMAEIIASGARTDDQLARLIPVETPYHEPSLEQPPADVPHSEASTEPAVVEPLTEPAFVADPVEPPALVDPMGPRGHHGAGGAHPTSSSVLP